MNENIDLTKILKNCPKGTILYSSIHGYVEFSQILNKRNGNKGIEVISIANSGSRFIEYYTFRGQLNSEYNNNECILFPSKEQRDWSKFTAPWYKKKKFDPNTLKPFDKVLVRDSRTSSWSCALYSHTRRVETKWKYVTGYSTYGYCIPYNDDTEHLVGTTEEAPEYYRYWED